MKHTPVAEWTEKMWEWAKRQVSFISRMTGNKGDLYDESGKKTRKHLSLLIWGNNPENKSKMTNKYSKGGAASGKDYKYEVGQILTDSDEYHKINSKNFDGKRHYYIVLRQKKVEGYDPSTRQVTTSNAYFVDSIIGSLGGEWTGSFSVYEDNLKPQKITNDDLEKVIEKYQSTIDVSSLNGRENKELKKTMENIEKFYSDKYAKGGTTKVYDSEKPFVLYVDVGKDEVEMETQIIRAKNIAKAWKIAEDTYMEKFEKKYDGDVRFRMSEAKDKFANGGNLDEIMVVEPMPEYFEEAIITPTTEEHLSAGNFEKEMAIANVMRIKEYAEKIDELVNDDDEIEAWVISKVGRVETRMIDIKQALKFLKANPTYETGGEIVRSMCLHIAKYAVAIHEMITQGIRLMTWMENNLAISSAYIDDVYHYLDYQMNEKGKTTAKEIVQGGKYANGGETYDYKKEMPMVEVMFANPKYNYSTSLSPMSTEAEARKYFVGKMFDVGSYPKEQMERVVDIKFYPKGTYANGGETKNGRYEVAYDDGTTIARKKFSTLVDAEKFAEMHSKHATIWKITARSENEIGKYRNGKRIYDEGGHMGFKALQKKVASKYVGKKVPSKYSKEYGKKYSKSESMEVGAKVAAKVARTKK